MYTDFYQLDRLPFENTPDPRFFFASEQHREALAAIEYVIRMRKGYVLVTGEIGSGKTTVGRTMIDRCSGVVRIVGVLHGHDAGEELLRQVVGALESPDGSPPVPPVPELSRERRPALLRRLQVLLAAQASRNQPVVLYVDEAQTLSDAALEELRLLSNFDTDTQKLIQVVLIGQPELRARLGRSGLAALRQRIVMAKEISRLTQDETGGYIEHRMRAAARDAASLTVGFSPRAVQRVFEESQGTPRLINFICDNCLLLGFVREAHSITGEMVNQVVADMVPTFDGDPGDATPDDRAAQVRQPLSLAGSF